MVLVSSGDSQGADASRSEAELIWKLSCEFLGMLYLGARVEQVPWLTIGVAGAGDPRGNSKFPAALSMHGTPMTIAKPNSFRNGRLAK